MGLNSPKVQILLRLTIILIWKHKSNCRENCDPNLECFRFADADHWLQYFPPLAKSDLQSMGLKVHQGFL